MRNIAAITGILLASCMASTARANSAEIQAQNLDAQAIALLRTHHQAAAAVKVRLACKMYPRWGQSWGLRGVLAFADQRYPTAQKYLRKAVTLNPHDPAELNNMAVLWAAENHPLRACRYYLRALAEHPGGHKVYDNIFSQLNRMVFSQALVFRTLKAAFTVADGEVQKRMATKGLIRYGATWVSDTHQRSVGTISEKFIAKEHRILATYLFTVKKLHTVNQKGRANQREIALLVHLANSDKWNNPVGAEKQKLFADQITQSSLLAQRTELLSRLTRLRREIRELLVSATGRAFCATAEMVLPDPASATETASTVAGKLFGPADVTGAGSFTIILRADKQIITQIETKIHSDQQQGNKKVLRHDIDLLKNAEAHLISDTAEAAGTKSEFLGCGGRAAKIVYILDHQGKMAPYFSFLKHQLRTSIDALVPEQQFAVIVFRQDYQVIGTRRLVAATMGNKKRFFKRFRTVRALGAPHGQFAHFARTFKAALRLKPQIIYFVTRSACATRLAKYIHGLNKPVKAHIFIYTIAIRSHAATKTWRLMAQENQGEYRHITRQQAER